jgi:photosynthetic reaction center M subunit
VSYYQNIFTQVQVRGDSPDLGVAVPGMARSRAVSYNYWLGFFGNAQVGPIYLGNLGVLSLVFGFFAFEVIGLNMWASVNWSPIQFIQQLPWLALEPPKPEYGLRILPPLNEGGWWLIAASFSRPL